MTFAATGNSPGVRWGRAREDTRLVTVTHPDRPLIDWWLDGPHIAPLHEVPQPLDVTGLDGLCDHLARLAEPTTTP
ncbi:hypothetical protein [Embleya sp. NPDC020886]|uniref:hypothetical protein n=1 Tax=Embleya sp. NPDC020886 TaxID=3363980 RepID=UPI00379CF274